MKIIFLINSPFPRYAGGIENWLYNVSNNLSDNHDITVISHEMNVYPLMFSKVSKNIKIQKFKTLRSYSILQPFIRSYLVLLDLFIGSYTMGRKLKNLIPDNQLCYVIALDSMFCVKGGLVVKNNNNVILISSVRGPHAELRGKSFKLFYKYLLFFEKRMLSKVDSVWANGYDTIDLLKKKGISSILMKNGINYDKLSKLQLKEVDAKLIKKDSITIANVGTLLPIKGIYELIEAVSILIIKYNLKINAYFIGKGEQSKYIKYAIKKEVGDYIHFLGHKEYPIRYIKQCNITTCLSGGSGMSMAAIESMASGIPIIAWDTPVYQQFNRNKRTMHLVKEKDSNQLAIGIQEILNKYELFLQYAENAKIEAQKYDWSIICNDLINELKNDY